MELDKGTKRKAPGRARCLLVCLLSAASPTWAAQTAGPVGEPVAELEAYWSLLHAAVGRCDWPAADSLATLVIETSERGSPSWLGGVAALAQTRYTAASPFGFQELAREALDLVEAAERDPEAVPLTSSAQRSAAQIEIALANAWQARGKHERAVLHLRNATRRLRSGLAKSPEVPLAEALLAQARSLLVLDRERESRPLLEELRDRFEGSMEAATASVLLQQGPEGIAAYRGRYEGDPGHAERMRVLWDLLPEARAEVTGAFGLDVRALERVPIGTVDRIDLNPGVAAVTQTNPRQPDFVPVVVLISPQIALGTNRMREVLVHELGHAALSLELGLAHERLPDWVVEGAVQALAEPWEQLADDVLALHMIEDEDAFFAPDFQVRGLVDFRARPCRRSGSPAAGLGLWPMERGIRERGWQGLVPALREHRSLDTALEAAFGQAPPPLDSIELEVARRLAQRRAAALPELEALRAAHSGGPAKGLEQAQRLLARSPTPLARGYALWDRATALEALGRLEEALTAYRGLGWGGAAQRPYVQSARQGYVRSLLRLGRLREAEPELAALERDANHETVSAWATKHLRDVRAALAK